MRSRYGLSALKMSKILGFGDNQYRLYENGEIPNVANGRVPNRWDRVYSLIDDIDLIEVEGLNGNIGNKLVSDMPCDISSFSSEQLSVLEKVYDTFKDDNSASISNKSHEEPAWIDNQGARSLIDFKYAFTLKAI